MVYTLRPSCSILRSVSLPFASPLAYRLLGTLDERSIITQAGARGRRGPLSSSLSLSLVCAAFLSSSSPALSRPPSPSLAGHSCPLRASLLSSPPFSFLLLLSSPLLVAAASRREMQGHAAPLLASKTVLDPRATLHTIREAWRASSTTRLSLLFSTWSPLTSRGALLDRERRHEKLKSVLHYGALATEASP